MMKLNDEQLKAINSQDRFIFLLAGAGSGKTRTIIEKIKSLLTNGVLPTSILAITFTKKATEEMKDRLQNDEVSINTFHGFCYQVLEKHHEKIKILDEVDLPFTPSELLAVSNYKNSQTSLKPPLIYHQYQKYLNEKKALDFDDLMIKFLELKCEYQSPFKYLFIDEFQDTNALQYEILKKLITPTTKVFAVGDPDQSIYRFRGAKPSVISLYINEFKATLYTLSNNYRSTTKIIDEANYFIRKNTSRIKKKLVPTKSESGVVNYLQFVNSLSEAKYIIDEIKLLINQKYQFNEIAIMYRNHSRATVLKKLFYENYLSQNEPTIHFLSCHESKGLEFRVVFIIGLEDGLFPTNYENRISEIEEERRLFFVAMTRAKEKLYVTYIKTDQDGNRRKPSLFLRELNPKVNIIS